MYTYLTYVRMLSANVHIFHHKIACSFISVHKDLGANPALAAASSAMLRRNSRAVATAERTGRHRGATPPLRRYFLPYTLLFQKLLTDLLFSRGDM